MQSRDLFAPAPQGIDSHKNVRRFVRKTREVGQ